MKTFLMLSLLSVSLLAFGCGEDTSGPATPPENPEAAPSEPPTQPEDPPALPAP